jgi:hypothetical protein
MQDFQVEENYVPFEYACASYMTESVLNGEMVSLIRFARAHLN